MRLGPLSLVRRPRVGTLGLDQAVNGSPSETGEKFLSQSVALGLAIPGAVIFVSLCSFECDGAAKEFVAQGSLVRCIIALEVVVLRLLGREGVEETHDCM